MNCPKCGKEISDTQKFCNFCGTKIQHEQPVEEESNVADVEQKETEQAEQDTISFVERIKSVPLYQKILLAVVGITIITVVGIFTYKYQQDIKPLSVNGTWGVDNTNATISTKYEPRNKQASIDFVVGGMKTEDWQVEYKSTYNLDDSWYSLNLEDYKNKIEYYSLETFKDKPIIIKFKVHNLSTKDFVKLKEKIKDDLENGKITISLPDFITFDKNIRAKAQKELEEYKTLKQQQSEDEEVISDVSTYAFRNIGGEKAPIDFNPRRCLFKVGGVCFGHPFLVHGMNYTTCKNIKDEYRVPSCSNSNDLYASTAYVCGGVKNMPTPDELVVLANDLYGANIFNNIIEFENCSGNYTSCNSHNATRKNKDYLEYFRTVMYTDNLDFRDNIEEGYRKNTPIFVMSNALVPIYDELYGRYFFSKASSFARSYRYSSIDFHNKFFNVSVYDNVGPYSICVDRSQSVSIGNKYPIKKRDYNSETENELF